MVERENPQNFLPFKNKIKGSNFQTNKIPSLHIFSDQEQIGLGYGTGRAVRGDGEQARMVQRRVCLDSQVADDLSLRLDEC